MSENTAVKKPAKKQIKIPTKKTLNLLIKEKTLASPTRLIPILFIIVAGAYLFSRYAVAARLEKVNRAEAELADMKSQLEMIQNAFTDYDEVEDQYRRYSYENFDRSIPDRVDVLNMIETRLFPICNIQSLTINGRDMNLIIKDIDMSTLTMINGMLLQEEPLIEELNITSYTDNTGTNSSGEATVTATINITLADASNTYTPGQLEFDPDAIIADGQAQANAEAQGGDVIPEITPQPQPEVIPEAQPEVTVAPEVQPEDTSAEAQAAEDTQPADTEAAGEVNESGGAE